MTSEKEESRWVKVEEAAPALHDNVICRNGDHTFIAAFYKEFWVYLYPSNGFELEMSNAKELIGQKVVVKEWLKYR